MFDISRKRAANNNNKIEEEEDDDNKKKAVDMPWMKESAKTNTVKRKEKKRIDEMESDNFMCQL